MFRTMEDANLAKFRGLKWLGGKSFIKHILKSVSIAFSNLAPVHMCA